MSYHSRMKKQVRTMPKIKNKTEKKEVEKKPESPVHKKNKSIKTKAPKQPTGWIMLSGLLAILFILSVLTHGFSTGLCVSDCSSAVVDTAINNLNEIQTKISSEEINSAIGIAITSLESAREKLEAEKAAGDYGGEYGTVKLEFYVMSQCPYGTQVMDAIAPVLGKLGDSVEFEANYISTDLGDGNFGSLHGDPETKGNIVQLCAAKYNPDKYMKMIVCQDKNAGSIPNNWESCASENGLDVEKIRSCYEGEEGKELLRESIKKTQAAGATGSPTIFVDGESYRGARDSNSFLKALCAKLNNHPECGSIPQCSADTDCTAQTDKIGKCENPGEKNAKCVYEDPVKVEVTFITDDRCKACNPRGINDATKNYFRGAEFKEIKFDSDEGRELMAKYNIKFLPAYIFDSNVEKTQTWNLNPGIQASFISHEDGTYRLNPLAVGSTWDPYAEVCDNDIDDNDNGKIDCEDDDCKDTMLCREEIEKHLQVFIMSDCPYGRKAVEALKGVVDNFGDDINYEVHYIAGEAGDSFNSLHGQYEVDEDIIQLCTKQHLPDEWFDYIYCRSTKGVSSKDWKDCAAETGVDITKVQACFDSDEGKSLLREDIKIANTLGIGASPTWLANNRYEFSGIDSETVKTEYCKYNEEVAGCGNTLSSDTGGVASGSC
ncbi:DsbA family protein [Candidatus Woesearchaeota archaeon]|nr:DsbA family protein [Candidatus Woesearchaeota archaeon]